MKAYEIVRGAVSPDPVEITETSVFVASDIHPYTETIDGIEISGYEYKYTAYTKDEYLSMIATANQSLSEQLEATKILLGVD